MSDAKALDIAAIKARADKATAGPWAWNSRHGLGAPNRLVMWPSHEYGCDLDIEGEEADLDFIAHARTDIPDLIAALEAAERERDACAGLASQAVSDMATAQNRITALEAELDRLEERTPDWVVHAQKIALMQAQKDKADAEKRIAKLEASK